jgi:hypothetical protein
MKRKKFDPGALPGAAAGEFDDRLQLAGPLRRLLNKVFPDHWSFLLGEISLYSFIVLLLTGTFLALFFDPSMTEVKYDGSYVPLKGLEMSRAYATSLDISFDVRGGLFMRQMHHWAALLFMASIVAHMFRIFFTGAFRKPRELNWIIGSLFWLGAPRASPDTRCRTTRSPAPACASPARSCCRSRSSAPGSPPRSSAVSSPVPRSSAGCTSGTCCSSRPCWSP